MRRIAWVGTLVLLLWGGPAFAEDESVGLRPAEAERLVTEAASVSPRFLNTITTLGARFSAKDLTAPDADVPMTLVVLVLGSKELKSEDLKLAAGMTPKAYAGAVYPMTVEGGERVPRHSRASLVQEEYVQYMEMSSGQESAQGWVRFRCPGAYAGTLHFIAELADDGWRVTELSFPASGVRTTLEQGRWRVHFKGAASPETKRSDMQLTLPQVGTLGPAPLDKPHVRISVTADGWIRIPGKAGNQSLVDVRKHLAEQTKSPALRTPTGSSRVHALLEIDTGTPWYLTQWLMQTCAHPTVRISNIWMAARSRAGQTGAIAVRLPEDRGLRASPAFPTEFHKIKIKAFKTERFPEPSGLGGVYEEIQSRLKHIPAGALVIYEIVAPPPKGGFVPHGYILGAVDACMAAGAKQMYFEGAAMPRGGSLFTSSTELQRTLIEARKRPGVSSVKVNNGPGFVPAGSTEVPGRGLREERWGTDSAMIWEVNERLEEVIEESNDLPKATK